MSPTVIWIIYPIVYLLAPVGMWIMYVKSKNIGILILGDGNFFGGAFHFASFFLRDHIFPDRFVTLILIFHVIIGIIINVLLVMKVRHIKHQEKVVVKNRHKTDKLDDLDLVWEEHSSATIGITTNLNDPSASLNLTLGTLPSGPMLRNLLRGYTWQEIANLHEDFLVDSIPALTPAISRYIIMHANESLAENPVVANQHPNI